MIFKSITYTEALDFLMPKHYMGRKPNISYAFGWFSEPEEGGLGELKAVCTFGKPASPFLCKGICGIEHAQNVYELNRLCRTDDLTTPPLSSFVALCLKQLKPLNLIIVSYSDTAMNHHGYIYQACNFLYLGMTKKRTDMFVNNGKHARHYKISEQTGYRKVRSSKHRYVYFCTSSKKIKQEWLNSLKYKILPYPKGDNSYYILGQFLKEEIVPDTRLNHTNSIPKETEIST